jgi:ferredoxin
MEILRDSNIGVEGLCGGACDCATCHVTLDEEWRSRLLPAGEEELDKLAELPNADESSRLSCQILWRDELEGLHLTLAEE